MSCICCKKGTHAACSLCDKPFCGGCFTLHQSICDKLQPFSEKEKASIVFSHASIDTDSKWHLDFAYSYYEIVRRMQVLGLDVEGFKKDVEIEIKRLRRYINIYVSRMVKYPDVFIDNIRERISLAKLPVILNMSYLNPTVPIDVSARLVDFFFTYYKMLANAKTTQEQVSIRAAALLQAVLDEEFVLCLSQPYELFHIYIYSHRPPDVLKDDSVFWLAENHLSSISFGYKLLTGESVDFQQGDGPSLYVIYQLALQKIREKVGNLSVNEFGFQISNNDTVIVPKGTYVYKGASSAYLNKKRDVAVWFALDKLHSTPYVLPDTKDAKSSFINVCSSIGGINVYRAKNDIKLLNLGSVYAIQKLREMMKSDKNILAKFDLSVSVNSKTNEIERTSYFSTDREWSEWMCQNTKYEGYSAPKLGNFNPELMICNPWGNFEYVGVYDAEDMGISFCTDDVLDIYGWQPYNAA